MYKIGFSKDIHPLVEGRPFILGGVHIDHPKGPLGHSDADCLLHAIAESFLGAMALGDLGKYFPDDDPRFKDYDSSQILKEVYDFAKGKGYNLCNLDCMVSLEKPKLREYVDQMREHIASVLGENVTKISIKATTFEGLGIVGTQKAIICEAICLIEHELIY